MEKSVTEGELFLRERGSAEFPPKQFTRGDRFFYLYRMSHARYFFLHTFNAHNICVYLYNQNVSPFAEMLTLIKIIF